MLTIMKGFFYITIITIKTVVYSGGNTPRAVRSGARASVLIQPWAPTGQLHNALHPLTPLLVWEGVPIQMKYMK